MLNQYRSAVLGPDSWVAMYQPLLLPDGPSGAKGGWMQRKGPSQPRTALTCSQAMNRAYSQLLSRGDGTSPGNPPPSLKDGRQLLNGCGQLPARPLGGGGAGAAAPLL